MSTVVYLNEFAWTFDPARAERDASAATGRAAAEDPVDVIRRFPSFSIFVDQLIEDLTDPRLIEEREVALAELEEERLLLARVSGR